MSDNETVQPGQETTPSPEAAPETQAPEAGSEAAPASTPKQQPAPEEVVQ